MRLKSEHIILGVAGYLVVKVAVAYFRHSRQADSVGREHMTPVKEIIAYELSNPLTWSGL